MANNTNSNMQYMPKRALQIQQEEGYQGLPGAPANSINSNPISKPSFRRARAGTLPSNLNSLPAQLPSLNLSQAGLSPAAIESLDYASQKPGLRHSHSSALNLERSPRLRSGSLTLPPSSPSVQRLADPFGSRFFYSRSNSQIGAVGEEIRSSDLPSEDACLRTLDYLGLDDPPSAPSSPRPNPTLTIPSNNQGQGQGFGKSISLNSPTRSRAYTLSTSKAADPFKPAFSTHAAHSSDHLHPGAASMMSNGSGASNSGLGDFQSFPQAQPQDPLMNSFNSSVQTSRPRAISMGILDEPDVIRSPARSGVPFPDTQPHPLQQSFNSYDLEMSQLDDPYSSINQVQTQQVPTRSLWIGGLDPRTTAQELMHVFAPYGAIESLRLLTDKECGFVNFVEKTDALRARDDVMHRLGGRIPVSTSNGGTPSSIPVRIGFGKIDSPQNPPSTSSLLNSNNNLSVPVPSNVPNQVFDGTTEQPTRALWLGSIPSTTTPATLLALFGPFGPIESARVLTHKNCGFVNYERLDDAVRARKSLNGRELLGPEIGGVRVGFAKVPVKTTGIDDSANTIIFPSSATAPNGGHPQALANSLMGVQGVSDIPVEQQIASGQTENYRSNLMINLLQNGTKESVVNSISPKLEKVNPEERPSVNDQQMIMSILSGGNEQDIRSVSDLRPAATYYTSIPPVLPATNGIDNQPIRKFDSSKLRELRKRLERLDQDGDKRRGSNDDDDYYDDENGQFPFSEDPEVLATRSMSEGGLLDNIVDLASDYIGNTIIQKLFEVCSFGAKMHMLSELAPHLAMIGCHKNGTWAAQKIIDCASTPQEVELIVQHIRPYAPPLLLDQFGNYVVQCCLRFGPPANEFIFDAMCDRIWDVAQGRFGARSMRAILESSHITLRQQKRLAISIILNSIPLATNPNGALLLTWLLDTSNLTGRYGLLAPRFTPHASHLITHKLASLTVLRLVNQKVDREATNTLLQAIFESPGDGVLFDALMDPAQGVSVITKLIVSPTIDPVKRQQYMESIKRVLTNGNVKITNPAAYRRLLDEINLPMNKVNIVQPLPTQSQSNTPPTSFSPPLQMQNIYGGLTPPTSFMNLQLQAHAQAQAQAAVLGHSSPPTPDNLLRTGNPFNAFR
ncbi:hypothetical protein E3P99_01991 [Wallemia hederae]|uniref:PUM-HD domain-containing protein n=1 Tax=Wallemia hederae TaxID=1540922 RepID=A0A4T0FPR7_9BASI|nr:hypothetical protein E3P99_01991 [Wallemia hederae]